MIKTILKKGMAALLCAGMVFGLLPNSPVEELKAASASRYEPLEISASSLNGNAIWGRTESSRVAELDSGNSFYTNDRYSSGGLPVDGKLMMSSGVTYQLATGTNLGKAYDGNDCIKLQTNGTISQEMELQTIGVYNNVYVLATAAGPGKGFYADFSVLLTYTDGTTSKTTYKLYDWYDTTFVANVEKYYNVKRYNTSNGIEGTTGSSDGPILHSATIAAEPTKLLKKVKFTLNGCKSDKGEATSKNLYCGIFAVTGATPTGVPEAPIATEATDVNKGSGPCFTANWKSVNEATSYRLDVATDKNFTQILSGYNNKDVGNVTSFKVNSGLSENTTYYYRVRAVNNQGQSLSSNRIATGVPKWASDAGITDEEATYDVESNTLTINRDVSLTNTITVPSGETTTIKLTGNSTVTAPTGKTAVVAKGTDTNLDISGDGKIVGGAGVAGQPGSAAIDISGTTGNSKLEINDNTTVIGGRGGDATEGNGGAGGAAIIANGNTSITIEGGAGEKKASAIGGDGGNGAGTNGEGGAGGDAIRANTSGGNVTVGNASLSGGDGGTGSGSGAGGNGGAGITNSTVNANSGNNDISGGHGGDGGTSGAGGNGGNGVSSGSVTANNNLNHNTISGGAGGDGHGEAIGGTGGNGTSNSKVSSSGTDITGGAGGNAENGNGGDGGIGVAKPSSGSSVSGGTVTGGDGGRSEVEEKSGDGGAGATSGSGSSTISNATPGQSGHTHIFNKNVWESDDTNHWHSCQVNNCKVKADEAAHTESKWIIDTPATKWEEGTKHTECTVCKKVLHTETIAKLPKDDSDYLTEAKDDIQKSINKINLTNDITAGEIESILEEAGLPEGTQITVSDFNKEDATTDATGKITGTVTIKYKDSEVIVPLNKVIPKIEKDSSEKQQETKNKLQERLNTVLVNNNSTEEDVKRQIEKILAEEGVEGSDVSISNLNKNPEATVDESGSVTGTITVKVGGESIEIPFERNIPKLPATEEEKVSGASAVITEQLELGNPDMTGKSDEQILNEIKQMLKDAGYTDVDPELEDVFREEPTEIENGSLSGNLVFKVGDQEITLPFEQVLPATGKSDETKLAEAKQELESIMAEESFNLSNQTTVEDLVDMIRNKMEAAGYTDVEIDSSQLNKTNASSIGAGSISGNLIIKTGNKTESISVNEVIPKLQATDEEKVAEIKSKLNEKLPTTLADQISSMKPESGVTEEQIKDAVITTIRNELQDLLVSAGYKDEAKQIVDNAFKEAAESENGLTITVPTTESNGSINGTLNLKLGDKKLGTIDLNETIPKLENGGTSTASSSQKALDAANLVKDQFNQISINDDVAGGNETDLEKAIEDQIKELLKKAGYTQEEADSVVPEYKWTTVTPATTTSDGKLEGDITFVCGTGRKQTIHVSRVIPKLTQSEEEKTEQVKQIEDALSALNIKNLSNSGSKEQNEEKIKKELINELKNQLKESGYSQEDIDNAEIRVDELGIVPPTTGSMGSVKGNITIKIDDRELTVPVNKVLDKLPKTDKEIVGDAKDTVKDRLSYITVSNDNEATDLADQMQKELEKQGFTDVTVTVKDYTVVTPATKDSKGLVSGTVEIKKGTETISYPFEKVIPKVPENEEEELEETKNEIQQKLYDDLNKENITKSKTTEELQQNIKKMLEESGQDIADVTVKNFKRTEPTSGKNGKIEGTITITTKGGKTFEIPYTETIPYEMSSEEKKEKTETIIKSEINNAKLANSTSADDILKEMEQLLKENGITDADLIMEDFSKTDATTKADGIITGTVKAVLPDGTIISIPISKQIPKVEKTDKEKVREAQSKIAQITDEKFQPVNSTTEDTVLEAVRNSLEEVGLSDVDVSIVAGSFTKTEATTDAEGTITATINIKSGKVTTTKKLTLTIPKIEQADNGNSGIFTVEGTEKKVSAPKTEIKSSVEEVKTAVPGVKEEQKVNVYLQVEAKEKDPEAKERQKIDLKAESENVTVGQYVDVSMIRKVTTGSGESTNVIETEISELNKKIQLEITIPVELRAGNRTYTLLHYHNGSVEAEVVDGTYNPATYTFTFYTDKFSTYAIAYTEKNNGNSGNDSGSTGASVEATKKNLDSASTTVKDALTKLPTTNVTSKEELESVIKNILSKEGNKDVTCEIIDFNKVDSTSEAEGKVTGTIRISLNGMSTLVPFSYTLAKVTDSKDDATTEKAAKAPLLATAKSGDKKVKLSWKKVTGATGYEVYTSVCDGGKNFKKTETKKLTCTIKNLSNKKSYKFYVRAYKVVDGKKVYLNKSPQIHVAMKDYKKTNAKTIKNVNASYKLTVGKKAGIRAMTVKENKNKKLLAHAAEFRYYSSDTSVATVNQKGVITAKKTGKCTICVVANNGVYKTIKVTVGE